MAQAKRKANPQPRPVRRGKRKPAGRAGASLDGIFRPRGVAVVGASRRPGSIGRQVVVNIVEAGFTGAVYPVNPSAETVMSMPSWPSVEAIPGPVDLAVLVVPPDAVLKVAESCGRRGVKGLVVVTAGFGEIGGAGARREANLIEIAARYGMRVIGPNCMGIINTEPAFALNASFAATLPGHGRVAMVSQSGALGETILADAAASGLGVAMFASVGNRIDVTAADLLEYWEHDDNVDVVLLYIESFGDPARFLQVARRVGRTKPILAVKSGRSDAGAKAASSHTGSVAGADSAADTMLMQAGVLRVDSFGKMFALAAAFLHQPLPRGERVAVVTNAGGPGILATDALVGLGLQMAEFSARTTTQLAAVLPIEASTSNPVDLIASADAPRYAKSLRAVLRDKHVDMLLVLFVSPIMIDAVEVAQAIVDEAARGEIPVMACVMGRRRGSEALSLLVKHGIPVFRYPEDAAYTLRMMARRTALLARQSETGRDGARTASKRRRVRKDAAATALATRTDAEGWLQAEHAEAVLAAYGIPFAASRHVAAKPADAVNAADALGYPVVLKAEARGLVHKSEHRAVVANLRDADAVHAAASEMRDRLHGVFRGLRFQVQAQAEGFRELLLGMTRDPRYGPVLAAGIGGTLVEVMRDVAFRVAPMSARDPEYMLGELQGVALLSAFRGQPAPDRAIAEDVLARIEQLALDFPLIAEVEVNPFILDVVDGQSVAVDARLRVDRK